MRGRIVGRLKWCLVVKLKQFEGASHPPPSPASLQMNGLLFGFMVTSTYLGYFFYGNSLWGLPSTHGELINACLLHESLELFNLYCFFFFSLFLLTAHVPYVGIEGRV